MSSELRNTQIAAPAFSKNNADITILFVSDCAVLGILSLHTLPIVGLKPELHFLHGLETPQISRHCQKTGGLSDAVEIEVGPVPCG